MVTLHVKGTPEGAWVVLDGKRLGRAPIDVPVPKGSRLVRFVVHRPGFRTAYPQITPSRSRDVWFKLKAVKENTAPR